MQAVAAALPQVGAWHSEDCFTPAGNVRSRGSVMTSFEYTYNLDGYVTQVERENGDVIAYQYDGVGRLIDENRSGQGTTYRNQFEYDPVGNRAQWTRTDPQWETDEVHDYGYNGLNQVVQQDWSGGDLSSPYRALYTYDLNGNLTKKEVYWLEGGEPNLDETWLYEWDSEDRLVKVVKKNGQGAVQKTVEYAYCPACGGDRTHKIVKSSTGAITLWLEYETEGLNQLRVDERWDSNGSGTITDADQWRTQRVSFNGPGQISQLMKEVIYNYPSSTTNTVSSQTTIAYHYDRMGVVAGLSNGSGAELQQFESDAFGSWDGLNTYTTRRITGKEYDEDVGLYFFHARWYSPSMGRFTSIDPLDPSHHAQNLGNSDPGNSCDPTGRYIVIGNSDRWPENASWDRIAGLIYAYLRSQGGRDLCNRWRYCGCYRDRLWGLLPPKKEGVRQSTDICACLENLLLPGTEPKVSCYPKNNSDPETRGTWDCRTREIKVYSEECYQDFSWWRNGFPVLWSTVFVHELIHDCYGGCDQDDESDEARYDECSPYTISDQIVDELMKMMREYRHEHGGGDPPIPPYWFD